MFQIKRPMLFWLSRKQMRWVTFSILSLVVGVIFSLSFLVKPAWQNHSQLLAGKIIAIDPGHGGVDGGSVSEQGDLEKHITLAISTKVKALLEQAGAIVMLTREIDADLADDGTKKIRSRKMEDLFRRAERIEAVHPNITLSIHLNATPERKWRGAQTFYSNKIPLNKLLAQTIQDELRKQLENTDREAKELKNVFLLRVLNVPNALVETGFLSNQEERNLLTSEAYQQKLAEAIYRGLIRYQEAVDSGGLGSG